MKHLLNSKGELETNVANPDGSQVVLNSREAHQALMLQDKFNKEVYNALGFEIPITTLYALSKSIVAQKFFEIAPADYMPIRVGENAWSTNILTYLSFALGGDFEAGNINTGSSDAKLAQADAGIDSVTNPVINWAKQINWSFMDLQFAAKSGNWDLVTSKEKARKTNWDLGIQAIAFYGSKTNTSVMGLLNQTGVNANTTLITQKISTMNAAQFSAFVAGVVGAYRLNNAFTAMPTHFIVPELDYNGLATLVPGTAGTFPVTMLQYLTEVFQMITRNKNFKIMPLAYADQVNNATIPGLNKNVYTLLNYNEDSLRMDIPVDYTNTMQNTINGFNFQNVGYGQYTGLLAYRPLEMLYFTF